MSHSLTYLPIADICVVLRAGGVCVANWSARIFSHIKCGVISISSSSLFPSRNILSCFCFPFPFPLRSFCPSGGSDLGLPFLPGGCTSSQLCNNSVCDCVLLGKISLHNLLRRLLPSFSVLRGKVRSKSTLDSPGNRLFLFQDAFTLMRLGPP